MSDKDTKKESNDAEAKLDKETKEVAATEEVAEMETIAIPDLKTGMVIRVYQKIKELNIKGDEKERVQYFEGRIIAKKHGGEAGGTITVQKTSNGVGVEKIFPLNLPTIERIEVKKIAKVRRSKLYFLKKGWKKKLKETIVKQ